MNVWLADIEGPDHPFHRHLPYRPTGLPSLASMTPLIAFLELSSRSIFFL
ncbi:hypothetical protein BH09VER1_BH09VER1_04160 [soil metagenome]